MQSAGGELEIREDRCCPLVVKLRLITAEPERLFDRCSDKRKQLYQKFMNYS